MTHCMFATTPSESITLRTILADLRSRPDIAPHSSQRSPQGSKKLAAFRTVGAVDFAIEIAQKTKQTMWFLHTGPISGMEYQVYMRGKSRHSNLHKMSGFKIGKLLRVESETAEEAR